MQEASLTIWSYVRGNYEEKYLMLLCKYRKTFRRTDALGAEEIMSYFFTACDESP